MIGNRIRNLLLQIGQIVLVNFDQNEIVPIKRITTGFDQFVLQFKTRQSNNHNRDPIPKNDRTNNDQRINRLGLTIVIVP
jgi:hypothetical protein